MHDRLLSMRLAKGAKNDRQPPLRCFLLCLAAMLLPLPCAWRAASAEQPIQVAFQADEVGKAPRGWASRNKDPGKIYSVQEEGGKKYLRADARDACEPLGYEKPWPLGEYPILRWEWRAVLFPSNSDERKKSGSDSALAVYVVFGRWPFIKCLKYIWSDTLPVGASFTSPFSSRTRLIVLRGGRTAAGTWVSERRDVLSDYRRFFDARETPTARGIAVLTDSDNTHSHAVGDYGEFETLPAAP
jgi:hypothetical protein